jgi:hypothetical protein
MAFAPNRTFLITSLRSKVTVDTFSAREINVMEQSSEKGAGLRIKNSRAFSVEIQNEPLPLFAYYKLFNLI